MNLHLVSFGSTMNFGGALTRCKIQASQWRRDNAPVFKSINIFDENYLQKNHPDFWHRHASHIQSNARGFGYWIWKSYVVNQVMNKVPENDIIMWMDIGCQFNFSAWDRLKYYHDAALQNEIVCFDVGMPESDWTKADTANIIVNNEPQYMNSGQLISTVVFWKNDDANKKLVNDWYDISQAHGYKYATDVASVIPNAPGFREHRHDQSILSLLIKKSHRYLALPDETYFQPNWHQAGKNYPIWATRNPTAIFI